MDEVFHKISNSNKFIITCGDFNINLLENSALCSKIISLFQSYNLVNLFFEPTRITPTSATCLDNIYTDVVPSHKQIINLLESDHCGQLITFENPNNKVVKKNITVNPKTVSRLETFKTKLADKLPMLSTLDDINHQYESFFNTYCKLFDATFIPKTISVNNNASFGEWATVGIHKSRNRLYELYDEKIYVNTAEFSLYVRNYSKLLKKVCSVAKSRYLSSKIKNSNNIIKTTWNIINSETGRSTKQCSDYKLVIDDNVIQSDSQVAAAFENFFSEIPILTTKSLNSSPIAAESLLKENVKVCDSEFSFEHVTYRDIIKTFNTLNVKKTTDLWGNSVNVVKSIINVVAPSLAHIFNSCIDWGEFPDLMKYSKLMPLFKTGSTTDPTNYRPISVLPTFSKIFEKLILEQLQRFFNKHKLLHTKQFGFTRGRSTTDAGVELLGHIYNAWEDKCDALGIFCDLSKAFDCVNHKTLIRKLHHYGIRNSSLDLLTSYLSDRIQRVDINGQRSHGSVITMGVPQGSILGPFLFLVYINDLPYLIKDYHDIVLFADDTSLLFKHKRQQSNTDDINIALSKIVHWFNVNNLHLNEKKTKFIKFTMPHVRQVETSVQIKGKDLSPEDTIVFLGITLDSKLQWGPHIDKLSKKLSSAAYAVRKIRNLTDLETARLVYFSYFHSVMSYGILLWGNAADIQTIFVLQKRAIRSIYKLSPRYSLRDKFKNINILTVPCQYIFDNILYVHKNKNMFKKYSDIHNVNTRNKHKFVVPTTRLKKIGGSFRCQCVHFYNKLPSNIQELSLNKFKLFVKRKLCQKAFYTVKEYLEDKTAWD
ncbi:hypothetical protein PYW08_003071 [Mythimna loreyi]|uniref:Uncharacterized protein n=1 Tax=Mythimna loreyi TaxID=667449 RepID=A0ACC2QSR0_9NEOP|nr:hypothetical protein PYW08_003071 [Mythimna loreyi]